MTELCTKRDGSTSSPHHASFTSSQCAPCNTPPLPGSSGPRSHLNHLRRAMSTARDHKHEEHCSSALYHEDLAIADNPFHLPSCLSSYLQCNECDMALIDQTNPHTPPHHHARTQQRNAHDHISQSLTYMLDTSTDQHIADYITHIDPGQLGNGQSHR